MNATKGYYCLLQYCPDIARAEAANVGVLLFSPEHGFLRAQMMKSNHRIRKFFGEEADNYQHLNAMKDSLTERLQIEKAEFKALADLQSFVETRANKVILTQPKAFKVFDPEADLAALYQELVADPVRQLTVRAALPLRKRLDDVLMEPAVKPFMQTNLKVEVPALKETLEVPYAFQNGRFNLIQPVEFSQQSESRIKNAVCRYAVEGLSLHRHRHEIYGDMQLIVVADFMDANPGAVNMVRGIFTESEVQMYTPDALGELRQEIITHGKFPPTS